MQNQTHRSSRQQQRSSNGCLKYFKETGIVTKTITCLLIVTHLCVKGLFWDKQTYQFSSIGFSFDSIVNGHQVYRIVTSAFCHGNFLHILMNTVAFVFLGRDLEVIYGSAFFLTLNIFIGFLGDFVYLSLIYLRVYILPPIDLSFLVNFFAEESSE